MTEYHVRAMKPGYSTAVWFRGDYNPELETAIWFTLLPLARHAAKRSTRCSTSREKSTRLRGCGSSKCSAMT